MKYENILLDLDGTLADPFEAIGSGLIYASEKMGYSIPTTEQIRKCIGPPLSESMGPTLGVPAEMHSEYLRTYREHHGREGIFHYRLYEGIAEVLKLLAQESNLYLATSKPTVYADPILERAGVKHLFSGIVGAELDGSRSHKVDIISYVMKTYSVQAQGSIMVGDRMHDAIGAQNLGMPWAGVLWGFGSEEELTSYRPEFLVERPEQLLALLI